MSRNRSILLLTPLTLLMSLLSWEGANARDREMLVLNSRDSVPVAGATVKGYDAQRDSLSVGTTDSRGILAMSDKIRYAFVSKEEYADQLATLTGAGTDTVWLQPATVIDELVVQASNTQNRVSYVSHIIPREDMTKYTNFYFALNEIPNLIVDRGLGLFYAGSNKVALMLNGVPTDATELRAISKDDVLKVNVYKIAPLRFLSQGYQSAIDIITKATLVGGNLAIDINQPFNPLYGDNNLTLFYNNRRSRFKVMYGNSNRHLTKDRRDEHLSYEFDGVEYYKDKTGLPSRTNVNSNTLTLGYQNNKPASYLFSVSVTGGIDREGQNIRQLVSSQSIREEYEAQNDFSISSNSLNINTYFEKSLGEYEKEGKLITDVTYKTVGSGYDSRYREFADPAGSHIPTVDEQSVYDIRYNTVMAEIMYQMPFRSWGQLSFSTYNNWQHSRYIEEAFHTTQIEDNYGVYARYLGRAGQFSYYATIGVNGNYLNTAANPHGHWRWTPTPSVTAFYMPKNNLWFGLGYSYSNTAPTIAQLSQTDQWLDTRLVYHGNSTLHSYSGHTVNFSSSLSTKYFDTSLQLSYLDAPGYICNYFMLTPDYMLETLVNLKEYRELLGVIDLAAKPLGTNTWTIATYFTLGRLWGAGETYDWRGMRFQWMSSTQVNLDKWNFYASFQYPGRVVMGQLVRPRTAYWRVGALFRPKENMSVGLELGCPFGKGTKESERTVNTALVDRNTTYRTPQKANMVSILFEWNLQFGLNRNNARQAFVHDTSETGVLRR